MGGSRLCLKKARPPLSTPFFIHSLWGYRYDRIQCSESGFISIDLQLKKKKKSISERTRQTVMLTGQQKTLLSSTSVSQEQKAKAAVGNGSPKPDS